MISAQQTRAHGVLAGLDRPHTYNPWRVTSDSFPVVGPFRYYDSGACGVCYSYPDDPRHEPPSEFWEALREFGRLGIQSDRWDPSECGHRYVGELAYTELTPAERVAWFGGC